MGKLFKSIATFTLAISMLVGVPSSVMAAELPQNAASNYDTVNAIQPRGLVQSFSYTGGSITTGKNLGSVTLSSSAKTIQYCADGVNGNVIIRLTKQGTGETRSFTAIGNGSWGSITYISAMSAGTWSVSVVYTSGIGHNSLQMRFYS